MTHLSEVGEPEGEPDEDSEAEATAVSFLGAVTWDAVTCTGCVAARLRCRPSLPAVTAELEGTGLSEWRLRLRQDLSLAPPTGVSDPSKVESRGECKMSPEFTLRLMISEARPSRVLVGVF
ncbi:MAG: hypothetical protein FRX49_11437 [Trebouxia sp. A1-2]|nr:MAG: hypothetical protein FRX49_11437 [Trebouxia sp. A1-2]